MARIIAFWRYNGDGVTIKVFPQRVNKEVCCEWFHIVHELFVRAFSLAWKLKWGLGK